MKYKHQNRQGDVIHWSFSSSKNYSTMKNKMQAFFWYFFHTRKRGKIILKTLITAASISLSLVFLGLGER
jgi:hypothetical protein